MPRKTTKTEVAERFARLVNETLPEFEGRVHWVIEERPPADAIRNMELITLCFTSGHFDWPNQVGGLLDYEGTISVRLWTTNFSDQSGVDREQLLAKPNGLFRLQGQLLKIHDHYLDNGSPDDSILLEGIKAISDNAKLDDDGEHGEFQAVLATEFGVKFQWDLSG
jgi:hypothetical protein